MEELRPSLVQGLRRCPVLGNGLRNEKVTPSRKEPHAITFFIVNFVNIPEIQVTQHAMSRMEQNLIRLL